MYSDRQTTQYIALLCSLSLGVIVAYFTSCKDAEKTTYMLRGTAGGKGGFDQLSETCGISIIGALNLVVGLHCGKFNQ